ncbi:NKG2-A/NKG2-B type II integral membrane protein-like [Sorex fumeus]|uniref:NKG2-A/NKG2-B type II integral membrane protein-like n=1 Tax=Sorex fumeus TaxID=62283 RepID=UPI0024AC9D50|nr:NKG2-A/NKG2-B type II integral membrane protein-like [Sorex fumeus]
MNNERVTYAELNQQKDSKRQQRKPKYSKSAVTETTPEITYTEFNLQNVSQDPQGNKQYHCRGFLSPPEKLIAGILGFLCLVMVVIVTTAIPSSEMQQSNNSSLELSTQNACHCPQEWLIYSNSCYYISNETKPWNESSKDCISKKSKLLYIDSEEEMNIFVAFNILPWSGPSNKTNDGVQISSGGSVFSSKS